MATKKSAGSGGRKPDGRSGGKPQGGLPKDLPGGYRNPYRRYRKLERPKLEPQLSTLWDYPSQQYGSGRQGDQHYVGATPSYVIWNVLSRFTKEGETVVDPFCGSGTSLDVCNDLKRKGLGFDVAPFRDDIKRADARKLPLADGSVDHAFLDPPYADNLDYSDDPACIGKTRADDRSYYQAMAEVFDELARVVKPGGIIAVYVSDIMHKGAFHPLGIELATLGRARFELIDHVIVKRYGQKVETGGQQRKARFGDHLARGFNHLLLFRVPARARPRVPDEAGGARRDEHKGRARLGHKVGRPRTGAGGQGKREGGGKKSAGGPPSGRTRGKKTRR